MIKYKAFFDKEKLTFETFCHSVISIYCFQSYGSPLFFQSIINCSLNKISKNNYILIINPRFLLTHCGLFVTRTKACDFFSIVIGMWYFLISEYLQLISFFFQLKFDYFFMNYFSHSTTITLKEYLLASILCFNFYSNCVKNYLIYIYILIYNPWNSDIIPLNIWNKLFYKYVIDLN